jgi:probable O-glycosylation ligase (exosortase A-associated)
MLLSGVAVLGTYSRGGFLAVSAMLLFLWLRGRHKLLFALIFVPLIPVAVMFMPERWGDRMDTIATYEQDGSAMARINTWTMIVNMTKDRPIVGGGFDHYSLRNSMRWSPTPNAVHSAHSVYFQMLGEHGYVGLGLFLAIGFAGFRAASRTIAAARASPEHAWAGHLANAIMVSLIGYAVGGAFVNIGYWDLLYYEIVILSLAYRFVTAARVPAPATARVVHHARA